MQKIAILTDSASDLDIEIMEKYNINKLSDITGGVNIG